MSQGFQQHQIDQWREQGALLLPNFFSAQDIDPIYRDYERIYGTSGIGSGETLRVATDVATGAFHPKQFANMDTLPYDGGVAMNLISLHPRLMALASELLGCDKIQLYQSHTWAKFTGDADYDQPFHCDFSNHTLTVPAEEPSQRTVNFVIYISPVSDDLGAMHYVHKDDAYEILGLGAVGAPPEHQAALREVQRSAAAPAGSVVAYSIDTFHRGTNMTAPGGLRYTMTVSFKRADNANIGFHVWQHAAHRPWHQVMNHGTPQQLACLGIPVPGDPFWTPRTLGQCQKRWPDWDMQAYRDALAGII